MSPPNRAFENQRGLSLSEVMVGTFIFSIMMLASFSLFGFTVQFSNSLTADNKFSELSGHVREFGIDHAEFCKFNLAGTQLAGVKEQDVQLYNFDLDGTKLSNLAIKGQMLEGGLTLDRVFMTVKTQLDASRYVAELNLRASKRSDVFAGKKILSSQIPIYAVTDQDGKIVSCEGKYQKDADQLWDKKCDLLGDDLYYDPVQDKCLERYDVQCFTGTQTEASCGPGSVKWYRHPCNMSGYKDDDVVEAERKMADGSVLKFNTAPSYICDKQNNFMVSCVSAVGVDISGAKCEACCLVDKVAVLGAGNDK